MTTTAPATANVALAVSASDELEDVPTSTQVDDLGDSQATLVGEDDPESVDASLPLVSRTVDHAGVVIAFNSNRSDEDGGRSEDSPQPRGPSRTNGSPGRGLSLPEPHPNTGV